MPSLLLLLLLLINSSFRAVLMPRLRAPTMRLPPLLALLSCTVSFLLLLLRVLLLQLLLMCRLAWPHSRSCVVAAVMNEGLWQLKLW